MKINYLCPYWGCEKDSANTFLDKVLAAGYEGVEIKLPSEESFIQDFFERIEQIRAENPNFMLVLQQLSTPENESVGEYITKMQAKLRELAALKSHFINSHTGKDYYTFAENCRVLEAAMEIEAETNIPIFHEIHRGRFSFHAPTLLPYLEKFPNLQLVGDFSHFCVVSESLLQGQEEMLEKIIPHIAHIHARVGSEQAPQVSDPSAPEWKTHLQCFTNWWQQILENGKQKGISEMSITPEFGAVPYLPVLPFTQQPIANQWNNNLFMKEYLTQNLLTN
jgi:sugar phosphate isomerase/epimerase